MDMSLHLSKHIECTVLNLNLLNWTLGRYDTLIFGNKCTSLVEDADNGGAVACVVAGYICEICPFFPILF